MNDFVIGHEHYTCEKSDLSEKDRVNLARCLHYLNGATDITHKGSDDCGSLDKSMVRYVLTHLIDTLGFKKCTPDVPVNLENKSN